MYLVTKIKGDENIVLGTASTEEEAREMVCMSEGKDYMREQEALGANDDDVDDDVLVEMHIQRLGERIAKLNYKIELV